LNSTNTGRKRRGGLQKTFGYYRKRWGKKGQTKDGKRTTFGKKAKELKKTLEN